MTVQSDIRDAELTMEPSVSDFIQLMKPRVMQLVVLTALAAMIAAPGPIHPVIGFIAILAIAVGAGASGALNMWYDADIDARMARTAARPLPRGRVTGDEALTFGIVLAAGSVMTLGVIVNWVAGALLALTIAFYMFVYTMWLKRKTPHNIVIGGAAGAFPPMIGWAAVTGSVGVESLLLFLIIFMWTPPHFWALALGKSADYEKARVPMLPVVAGVEETCRQIVVYTALLIAATYWPVVLGDQGLTYFTLATLLNALLAWRTCELYRNRSSEAHIRAGFRLFGTSILYLFGIFVALLAGV